MSYLKIPCEFQPIQVKYALCGTQSVDGASQTRTRELLSCQSLFVILMMYVQVHQ